MMLPSLFKTHRNRQFTYRPVFYNPEKEIIKERIKKIEREFAGINERDYKIGIARGTLRQYSRRQDKSMIRTSFRLAIITLLLLGLAWYLLH
jgi:hypothetical protein